MSLRKQLVEDAQGGKLRLDMLKDTNRKLDHGVMVPLAYIDKEYSHNLYQAILIGGVCLAA